MGYIANRIKPAQYVAAQDRFVVLKASKKIQIARNLTYLTYLTTNSSKGSQKDPNASLKNDAGLRSVTYVTVACSHKHV